MDRVPGIDHDASSTKLLVGRQYDGRREGGDPCSGGVPAADEDTLTASLTSETRILWRRLGGPKGNSGRVSPMISEARSPQLVSPDEAIQLARGLYGLEVSASSLPGEYDSNFHLITADGRAFVLKVMHSSRDRAFIDMQCAALMHLARRVPELALPRVQLTRLGETFAKASLRNGTNAMCGSL